MMNEFQYLKSSYLFICFFFILTTLGSCKDKIGTETGEIPFPTNGTQITGDPKDAHTVALWLFDETGYPNATITDASRYEVADLLLYSGFLAKGKYGNALSSVSISKYNVIYAGFAGNGARQPREADGVPGGIWGPTYASPPLLTAIANDYTFEFWLNLAEIPSSDVILFDMGRGFEKGFTIKFKSGISAISIENSYSGKLSVFNLNDIPKKQGTFIHFALVMKKDGTGQIFINGNKKYQASVTSISAIPLPDVEDPRSNFQNHRDWPSMKLEERQQKRFNLSMLEDRRSSGEFNTLVDEIRVSDVLRFDKDFIPTTYSKNYSTDPYRVAVVTGLTPLFAGVYNSEKSPLDYGIRKHIFVDSQIIESAGLNNIQLIPENLSISSGEKTNITRLDGEWRISFVQDGDKMIGIATANYNSNLGLVYYYETTDGINFTAKKSNMINYPMGGDLFIDSNPNALIDGTRFKLTAYLANRGIYLYTSPDAINWKRNETAMLPLLSGGSAESFYDDQTGQYVTYLKRDASFGNAENPTLGVRASVRFASKNPYEIWPFTKMSRPYFEDSSFPVVTGEGPTQFIIPNGKQTDEQVYRTRVIKYPYAPDTYLSFPWIYHANSNDRDVSMAVSRDGNDWKIQTKPYYIDKGSFVEAISCQGLFRNGDELWQYIEVGDHHGSGTRNWYRVKQRFDGFCSLVAAGNEGDAITKTLKIGGDKLFVNYKCGTGGYLNVQILDASSNVMTGFSTSELLTGNNTSQEVSWGTTKFADLKGKNIRIKFIMKNAKLYAFETK